MVSVTESEGSARGNVLSRAINIALDKFWYIFDKQADLCKEPKHVQRLKVAGDLYVENAFTEDIPKSEK